MSPTTPNASGADREGREPVVVVAVPLASVGDAGAAPRPVLGSAVELEQVFVMLRRGPEMDLLYQPNLPLDDLDGPAPVGAAPTGGAPREGAR